MFQNVLLVLMQFFVVFSLANCVTWDLYVSMSFLESLIFPIHSFFYFCEIMKFLFEFFFGQKTQNNLSCAAKWEIVSTSWKRSLASKK